MGSVKKMAVCWIVVVSLIIGSEASLQQDEQDCADQLTNLASCIPYVSGTAKNPTPQCCQDTQKVKASKPKCLCVLIKESTDPSMGLPVNTTLALHMPSACNIDAEVSDCPSILNLPPDSPDAKIFKEAAASSDAATAAPADSPPTSASSSSSGSSNTGSKATSSSNNGAKKKMFWGGVITAFAASMFM
ncbi:lipid binding protein, putative [Ricinus communis]|uniref:Lipid binding protein, putative n=1 Tax=Ricinus communis TaxID=3988 RepID=B9RP98_RICCO|nr:lipid binding protein, putative [Ricinus communis]|eukprot:XP_002515567.1 protein YLS3 [Ricinus communis]